MTELSEKCRLFGAGQERGRAAREAVCHMPSMLNPSWVAGPGSGTARSWLVRNNFAVAVRSSKGATGCGRQY